MSSRLIVTGGRFHRYTLDGERVPSVTGITGCIAKDALAPAAAKETALWAATNAGLLGTLSEVAWVAQAKAAYRAAWDRSRDEGTQVHSIAARLIHGDPVATTDPDTGDEYSDDVVRMGGQVARFLDAWDVTPDTAYVELPVFNDQHGYAGRFDLCAILRGGERWLIDYKSGASGVWGETALQCTAYARATHVQIEYPVGEYRDLLMPKVQRCAALWVRPDSWELLPVKSDDEQWRTFLAAMPVAAWAKHDRDELIGAPLPVPALT